MPEDPIERLNADIEIFGIPQTPGMPPMTESFLHIRRRQDGAVERAIMGLPAYQGEPGERGPAGMVHQGTRTRPELEGLAMILGENELNYTYRCDGTTELWVWTGSTFKVYENAFGTKGDKGDPPTMQGGTVTVDGVPIDAPAGVRVEGAVAGGPYTVGIDLPALPEGPPGPPGRSGPIYDSVDVDQTTPPTDQQILVHNEATGKLEWRHAMLPVAEYSIASGEFPTVTKQPSDTREVLVSFTLPAQSYRYIPRFSGGLDLFRFSGQQIDVEILLGDPVEGELYGIGRGSCPDFVGGWDRVSFETYSAYGISPESPNGTVPPSLGAATFYVVAVKRSGNSGQWKIRPDYAQLRVRLERALHNG